MTIQPYFVSSPVTTPVSERCVRLLEPLEYVAEGQKITVPAMFVTDGASIPRFFWWLFLPMGKHFAAAIIHDWLYYTGARSKFVADAIFCEAIKALGCSKFRQYAMFYCVLFFGWNAWRNHRKAGHSVEQWKKNFVNGNN